MAAPMSFDVLVVGSGASSLAAALSAERAGARTALVAKDSVQSCNSAKAQGGIQAAFGEDDSPEIHAEDVWRSSHETANRRLPPGPLRRRDPSPAAPGRRPHRPCDHEGAPRGARGLERADLRALAAP